MTPAILEIKLKKIVASCENLGQLTTCNDWFVRVDNKLEELTGKNGVSWSEVVDDQRMAFLNNFKLKWYELEVV